MSNKVLEFDGYSQEIIEEYYGNLLETFRVVLGLTDEQALTAVRIATGVCRTCMNADKGCCCSPAYDI